MSGNCLKFREDMNTLLCILLIIRYLKKKKGMSLACHIGLLSDNTLAGKVVNDTKLFHLSLTNNLGHLKSALNETNKTKFSL